MNTHSVGSRNIPGVQKADTMERAGSFLVYAHHVVVVAVGAFGLIEAPSPAVAEVIGGTFVALVWSVTFVVFGMLALLCRVLNRVLHWLDTTRSEAMCIALIGAAMFLFSALIMYSTLFVDTPPPPPNDSIPGQPGSIQTALALLSSSAFLPGVAAISLANTRRVRIQGKAQNAQLLREVTDEIRRNPEGN